MELKFLEYNAQGIIPGPTETEEEFLSRAEYCLGLKEGLRNKLCPDLPFPEAPHATDESIPDYDIAPRWVPIFYSDYQLSLWQGGCAWIFQIDKNSPTTALIQLRKHFRDSKSYFQIYKREEILTHELAHIGRLSFEEPKFEEFFAYRTSGSRFRKIFGPIVKSSFESLIFVLTLIMVFVLDLSLISLGNLTFYSYVMWTKLIPLALIFFAFARLLLRHYQFNRCLNKIEKIAPTKKRATAAMYRMTDLEIISLGKMNFDEISEFTASQKDKSLRWQIITTAYLS